MKKSTDQYFLMHKDIVVCSMQIGEDGSLGSVRINAASRDHVPIGAQMNEIKFHDWWKDRAIPKTRHGAKSALQKLGYASTNSALVDNLALSLSDCYWIKPQGENLTWRDVSLFTNDFVDMFGDLTINCDTEIDLRNKTRFSCASQGEVQKKWCIADDGRRYLVKGNYGGSYQQSINELFAASIHRQLGFENYTEYYPARLTVDGNVEGFGCFSYDFCCEELECISAWELLQTGKLRKNESYYHPLLQACKKFGITTEEFISFMDYQIMTDYLITNTDRHMNNIAVVRDPDTLEVKGFAPIYDSGNSMFYNIPFEKLETIHLNKIVTHSFVKKEVNLLAYVQDRNVLNPDLIEPDFSLYENDIIERKMRIPLLKDLFEQKMMKLKAFQSGRNIWKE